MVNIVVDNAFPNAGFGPGALTVDPTASISFTSTGGTPEVRIFSSIRSLNSIGGMVQGTTFVPGPYNVNSAMEIWSTYFPSSEGSGISFTFFYKEPVALLFSPVIQQSIVAQLEMLRDFLSFEELIYNYAHFKVDILVQDKVLETLPFSMRLRNFGTNMPKQIGEVLPNSL